MGRSLADLESIVRNRICIVCTSRTAQKGCGLEDPSGCALFRFFPRVVQAIQPVHKDDVQQYVAGIRRNVCAVCASQDANGWCEARREVQCALDAYLLLVADAIQEATSKTFDPKQLRSVGGALSGPGSGARMSPQVPW